ncbi:aldo/keto reductase [Bordetella bronchialis]|uniref:Alcohol dehydrogenase n=1 Tax=Bordetella bronchialis TaxID=463025 RepID=A0A193FUR5_9BORD|nr:aldo/keto reductase [Bordetella bronchialis]ANN66300.1 alcohol dehydrogenase [Bordetella bronchialis]ANN71380.1 alcohol dehydrogenase [Bordetella bronchialis]
MQQRQLGRSGLSVPPLAFGGNVFGWTVGEADAFSLLDAMVDAGLNFIDTADVYSRWAPGNRGGESEVIIGKWLAKSGKRDKVVIATKVGMEMGPKAKGLSPAYIARAVDDSLARLQTDYIDLYQSHRDDPDTPLADTLGAYGKLREQGKIRAIGASNYTAARLSEALILSERNGLPRYESIQPEYNLYAREPYESGLQAVVTAQGLGTINYYALASGFLSGKYRTAADAGKSVRGKKIVETYLNERGQRILAALDQGAEATGATPAQVALAWTMAQPGITAPIASATSLAQLDDLVKAAYLQLPPEIMRSLDEASAWR